MRRSLLFSLLSLAISTLAFAAGWKKAYFGATKPGTWARYIDHSSDPANPDMTVTQTRLGDVDGQPRIDIKMDSAGKYPLVQNTYTLKAGFAVDRDLLDYGPAIAADVVGDGTDVVTTIDAATVAIIANAMPVYGPAVVFKGSETIDGKKCDRYAYSIDRPGPSVEKGDYWLSDTVPFGVVRNKFAIVENGKTTTFERKLVASGIESTAADAAVK
jgi:hypothetical protein